MCRLKKSWIFVKAFAVYLLTVEISLHLHVLAVKQGDETDESVVIAKEPKPGWVRFCSGANRFDIFSNQCPAGFFWKPDFKIDKKKGWECVCTRGAWRRSNHWCSNEDAPRYVQGEATCFEPGNEENLQGMFYLGDQHSAWDSGEPVLLTSYKSGFTIRSDDFDKKWPLPPRKQRDTGVIIVRPRDDWTVEDQNNPKLRLCLRAPIPSFAEESEGIFIYNVSKFFSSPTKANVNVTDIQLLFSRTCFSWRKGDGKQWFEVLGESMDDKNMVVTRYINKTASAVCRRCMSEPIPDPPKTDVYGNPIKRPERRMVYDLKNVGVLTSEINLQSERVGLYWANRLLRNDSDYAKGDFQELEILHKAAVLAYGTCDMNFIPKQFYQYFLVMFRKLLAESFQKYAPSSPVNSEYYKKIEDLLELCRKRTKPIKFVVDGDCPSKFSKYKEYKTQNGTSEQIPKVSDYAASPAKHDYLLEFVWKLKSFLHYNCFPEFKDDSVLHDLIQNQLEALFTEDILLRWFNPSLAFRVYDHVFKTTLDLKTTMNNFEKCVRVVHNMNKFPVWLKRPIDQPHRTHQPLFAKRRRKRRAIESDRSDGLEDAVSMESAFADMAVENIREKRTEDAMLIDSDESIPVHIDILPGSKEGDVEEETSEDSSVTISPDSETATEAESGITIDDEPNKVTAFGESPADVVEETTPMTPPSDDNVSPDAPSSSVEVTTENLPIVEESVSENMGGDEDLNISTLPEQEETTPISPEDNNEETVTESSANEDVSTTEDAKEEPEAESSSSSASSTPKTGDEDGETFMEADEVETTEPILAKISPELSSSEALYFDSSEDENDRAKASDIVWNKFPPPAGGKGFVGACIESMSMFADMTHQVMTECW